MIIAIIIAVLIFGYSIYQTRQYNKLEDKYKSLQLEYEDLETTWLINVNALKIEKGIITVERDSLQQMYSELLESKTPVVIEPIITVDDATEVIKPKRGRKKSQ